MKQKYTYKELLSMLDTDSLTEILSRHYIDGNFDRIISQALSDSKEGCLAVIDVDFFKNVNDTYGHIIGDSILRQTAQFLKSQLVCSKEDYLARYGGDEFVFLSLGISYTAFAEKMSVCAKQLSKFNFSAGVEQIRLSVSIGCTDLKTTSEKPFTFHFQIADEKMYRAKQNGRNKVEI